jgi:hypothetical protein
MAYDLPDPRIGYEYYVSGPLEPGAKWYNCSKGNAVSRQRTADALHCAPASLS